MSKTIKKFLLAGEKCMTELHLRQPGFTYSACVPFTKHRERIKKFRETGNLKDLYKNELYKSCFAHDSAYSNSKELAKRTIGHQRAVASMVYKFFDKKSRIRSQCKWTTSWRIT